MQKACLFDLQMTQTSMFKNEFDKLTEQGKVSKRISNHWVPEFSRNCVEWGLL